jgi:hypothetical protein
LTKTEGFATGEDEAIRALSDPPYYTTCPNPFLAEIVAQWQQEERRDIRAGLGLPDDATNGYSREPFAADMSEGKNDPIFGNAQFLPHQGASKGDHALHPHYANSFGPKDTTLDSGMHATSRPTAKESMASLNWVLRT